MQHLTVVVCVAALAALVSVTTGLTVWPQPQSQTWPSTTTTYTLDPYYFNFNATGFQHEILDNCFRVSLPAVSTHIQTCFLIPTTCLITSSLSSIGCSATST